MSAKRAFFSVFQKIMVVCCAIFFGFANAFSANLPSGYTELEYIESTGTQYINTGVVPSSDMRWELDNEFTGIGNFGQGGSYNGLYDGSAPVLRFDIALTSAALYLDYGNLNKITIDTQSILNHRMIFKIDAKNMQWAYGGNTGTLPAYTDTVSTRTKPIYLFARNDSSGVDRQSLQKTYSSKIYKNEALVQELIPAKNSSGVVGMYDTVGNRFYTNQGTGTFTAGPVVGIRIATTAYNSAQFNPVVTDLNSTIATIRDVVTNTINQTKAIADLQAKKQTRPDEQCPAGKKCLLVEDNNGVPHWYEIIENIYGLPTGYTALEYIESTGTQYINTGVDINSGNFSIDTDMQFTALTSPQYYGIYGGGYFGITDSYFAIGGHGTSVTANKTKHNFVLSSSIGDNKVLTLSVDGTNYTYTRNVIAGRIALLTVLNGSTTMGLVRAKMYSVKIYQNNTLVRNMVPAKNSSGVIGMYDLVNDVFYINSGTGTFTAGPEI